MTIKITKIGNIDNGIDGSEEYLLLTDSVNGYLTENQAWDYLGDLFWPHGVKTLQKTDNQVVGIVYHQYNV